MFSYRDCKIWIYKARTKLTWRDWVSDNNQVSNSIVKAAVQRSWKHEKQLFLPIVSMNQPLHWGLAMKLVKEASEITVDGILPEDYCQEPKWAVSQTNAWFGRYMQRKYESLFISRNRSTDWKEKVLPTGPIWEHDLSIQDMTRKRGNAKGKCKQMKGILLKADGSQWNLAFGLSWKWMKIARKREPQILAERGTNT